MAPRITLAVGPASGSQPTQPVTAFEGGTLKLNLAAGPEVGFQIPGRSVAARQISGLASDVWVYRNGVLFRRCRILPVAQAWGESGEDTAAISAVGYKRVVMARHVRSGPPVYLATDQGAILWALIGHTQAQTGGNLGITAGTYLTGVPRDRTEIQVGDQFGTIMSSLSTAENGVWWDINATKVFSAKLWSTFPTRTQPIIHGVNARTMSRTPGPMYANAAGAVGSREQTVAHWVEDPGLGSDPRGLWEAFDSSRSSTVLQATVEQHAQGLLDTRVRSPQVWTIELDPAAYFDGSSGYDEGDYVRVVVPASAVDEVGSPVDVLVQITEVSIGFTPDGATTVTIAAEEVG